MAKTTRKGPVKSKSEASEKPPKAPKVVAPKTTGGTGPTPGGVYAIGGGVVALLVLGAAAAAFFLVLLPKGIDNIQSLTLGLVLGLPVLGLAGLFLTAQAAKARERNHLKTLNAALEVLAQGAPLEKTPESKALYRLQGRYRNAADRIGRLSSRAHRIEQFLEQLHLGNPEAELKLAHQADGTVLLLNELQKLFFELKSRAENTQWRLEHEEAFWGSIERAADLKQLAHQAAQAIASPLPYAWVGVYESVGGEETPTPQLLAQYSMLGAELQSEAAVKEFLAATLAGTQTREQDAQTGTATFQLPGSAPALNPQRVLAFPLRRAEKPYGLLHVVFFEPPTERELNFLQKTREVLGAAIAQQRQRRHLELTLQEQRELQQKLQTREKALTENNSLLTETQAELVASQLELTEQISALNNAGIVAEIDLEGRLQNVNDQFLETTQYTREEVEGQPLASLLAEDSPAKFDALKSVLFEGRIWRGKLKAHRKDGTPFWTRTIITPLRDRNAKLNKFISVQFDITRQMEQEEEIRQALSDAQEKTKALQQKTDELQTTQVELRSRIAILNASAIVSETDLKGDIVSANDQFSRVSQYTREELLGQNHRMLKSGHQPDSVFNTLWKSIANGQTWRGEFKNRAKDGSFYWVTATISPMLGTDGKPNRYISVAFDITAQKLQEEQIGAALEISTAQEAELRENAKELQEAHEEMRRAQIELRGLVGALHNAAVVVVTNLEGEITRVNATFQEITQYTEAELLGNNLRMLKSGSHDPTFYQELWSSISQGDVWRGTFHNKAKDGSDFWLRTVITPVLGFDGNPTKYISVSFDVTPLRQQRLALEEALEDARAKEVELREAGERMQQAQLALEEELSRTPLTPAMWFELNNEGSIHAVSEALQTAVGLEDSHLFSQPIAYLSGTPKKELAQILDYVAQIGRWQGVMPFKRQDGSTFFVITALKTREDTTSDHILGLAYDLTPLLEARPELTDTVLDLASNPLPVPLEMSPGTETPPSDSPQTASAPEPTGPTKAEVNGLTAELAELNQAVTQYRDELAYLETEFSVVQATLDAELKRLVDFYERLLSKKELEIRRALLRN